MGTKENPGAFDCHAAAAPDEPLFTLLARDPLAPHLVRMWAYLRAGQHQEAYRVFGYARAAADQMDMMTRGPNWPKIDEAKNCADAMTEWMTRVKR